MVKLPRPFKKDQRAGPTSKNKTRGVDKLNRRTHKFCLFPQKELLTNKTKKEKINILIQL
jgi:hypothetical protein